MKKTSELPLPIMFLIVLGTFAIIGGLMTMIGADAALIAMIIAAAVLKLSDIINLWIKSEEKKLEIPEEKEEDG